MKAHSSRHLQSVSSDIAAKSTGDRWCWGGADTAAGKKKKKKKDDLDSFLDACRWRSVIGLLLYITELPQPPESNK